MKSYIDFVDAGRSKTGKTRLWHVVNKENQNVPIGLIRWHGAWRKYVFEQEGTIFYDWNCLREIADFIEAVTKEHMA